MQKKYRQNHKEEDNFDDCDDHEDGGGDENSREDFSGKLDIKLQTIN